MKKKSFKVVSVVMLLCFVFVAIFPVQSFCVANEVSYTITNPYENVTTFIPDESYHYQTNLHTHSTVSDGDVDYADMIKEYYRCGFDILAMADHGVVGKNWNEEPTHVPLYTYQYIAGRKTTKLTDDEFEQITSGTYAAEDAENRTPGRGMNCVPGAIELNMLTITKSHVNGYFVNCGNGDVGFENGFEYAVKMVDENGGVSHINHPGDWLDSSNDIDMIYSKKADVFTEVLMKYKSCLGIEVFNCADTTTRYDRVLWDKLLMEILPYGERNVFGFGNSDAHYFSQIDTSFMDFVMPEFSLDNLRTAMETGSFFAVSRFMRDRFGSEKFDDGDYPTVIGIEVNDELDTITITGKNCDSIEWIADGNIIQTDTEKVGDVIISTIHLCEHSDDIGCYVRAQLLGKGGFCLTQPFICDDGDMASHIIYTDNRTESQVSIDKFVYMLKSSRFYVIIEEIFKLFKK